LQGEPLVSQGNGTWITTLHVKADESKSAGGQQSSVNVSASTPFLVSDPNGGTPEVFPTPSNPRPPGSPPDPQDSGACALTCSVSKSFTWKSSAIGKVKLTPSAEKIFPGTTVQLTAEVEDAKIASVAGAGTANAGQGLKTTQFKVKPTEST